MGVGDRYALKLEMTLHQAQLDLHKITMDQADPHEGCVFLESHILEEEVKLGDHSASLARLKVAEVGMGQFLFDKLTLDEDSN
ncbi:ferritin light chain, oocyte isoform-like [Rhinatrema bivittatum]|uniref:ferritin light chain, oocyte isoform-like n=1 Tax=Rhinatrema bivittatum TaxID=194408 RepID=UPI00112CD352|nr:ferritin light chain, oocyte isoform-like [Rhinatrema bivittatum]